MKKNCFLIAILFLVLPTKPLHADNCLNFSPPGSFEAAGLSISDIRERLGNSIKTAAKECGPEANVSTITAQEITPLLAAFHYSVKYGWRAGDVAEQTLVYKKSGKKWTFVQALGERIDDTLDLNGDAVPELLVSTWRDFRTVSETTRALMAWNEKGGTFTAIKGFHAFSMTDTSDCNDSTERKADMKIEKSSGTYPLIVLTRTTIVRDKTCTEKTALKERWDYRWNPDKGTYLAVAYHNSRKEQVLFRLNESTGKIAMAYKRGGKRTSLKSTFSPESTLFDFSMSGGYLYFKADDNEWQSEYAWQVKNNTLSYRVKNKKTGKIFFSKGNAKAVFGKNPWISSL